MPVTLGELRQKLAEYDHLPEHTVVALAKDGEGDEFSPLDDVDEGRYLAETRWSGEHYMTEEQRQALDDPDDHEKAPEDAVPAVFLWPAN